MSKVATGLATGKTATPELAAEAVTRAMEKADIQTPTAVLLFLSTEFSSKPEAAIKAAAKTAACTQIVGCSALGIFTEEDWVLDSPAVAAMVFGEGITLSTKLDKNDNAPRLTLAAPNAINSTWLDQAPDKFGGISGDVLGQGAFSVWENGKGVRQGHCEVAIKHANIVIKASHGFKVISEAKQVTSSSQYDLQSINHTDASADLLSAWQQLQQGETPPYHRLAAVFATDKTSIINGDYHVATIINHTDKAVTMSNPIPQDAWLSWAVRDTNTAQVDMVKTACDARLDLINAPAFAMLFSSFARGPSFYHGDDQDLALLKTLFPNLPIIGFYGNGEIAPIAGQNEILQSAAVLGLFSEKT